MASTKSWRIGRWPPLAWLETVIKLTALGIALGTAVSTLSSPNFTLPNGLSLAQLIILFILALGLLAAIFDRLADREIVAMVFVLLNNLGHWGLVFSLAAAADLGNALWLFASFMLLGDLVKIWFIKATNFTVRDFPQRTLYMLTLVYVVGYGLILILEWLK